MQLILTRGADGVSEVSSAPRPRKKMCFDSNLAKDVLVVVDENRKDIVEIEDDEDEGGGKTTGLYSDDDDFDVEIEKMSDDDEIEVCFVCGGTPCEWIEFGEDVK